MALRDPDHIHAICENYRAAATIDREHDQTSLSAGQKIACPLLALWSGEDALTTCYADAGGPLTLWRRWAADIAGEAMPGGHFFPEHPAATARALTTFLSA